MTRCSAPFPFRMLGTDHKVQPSCLRRPNHQGMHRGGVDRDDKTLVHIEWRTHEYLGAGMQWVDG